MDSLTSNFNFDSLCFDEIKADAGQHITTLAKLKGSQELFTIHTANHWMEQAKQRPIPLMLFDVLFHEGEICILFADTNLGKSILAVQIGNSISTGETIRGFRLEAPKQKVLYFDFELSDKQFEVRYSKDFTQHFKFDDNFMRAEINSEAAFPDSFRTYEDYLNHSFEKAITETGAKVLIIDNLTYLRTDTEKAKDATPLMQHLKALKKKYGLSILILAHTPKRDLSKPLSRNDLSGSKMLINFCDSAFAIGESHTDKRVRYLKQIKERNTEKVYDSENIALCQVTKDYNFLQFELIGFGTERDHLKQLSEKDKHSLAEKARELHKNGKSYRDIGSELGISHTQVARLLKECNNL